MAIRTSSCLAAALLLAAAAVAPAHAQNAANVMRMTRSRANVAYTGMHVGGRPATAPDGTPRWSDYPVLRRVDAGSPAARVGLAPGDVLLRVNGADARDPRTLFAQPGTVFTLRVRRGAAVREFVLTGTRPPDPAPPAHD